MWARRLRAFALGFRVLPSKGKLHCIDLAHWGGWRQGCAFQCAQTLNPYLEWLLASAEKLFRDAVVELRSCKLGFGVSRTSKVVRQWPKDSDTRPEDRYMYMYIYMSYCLNS